MNILTSLIIAVLFYKIKLIDDRKQNNIEKFKNFLKRRNSSQDGRYEQDEWLEKDIQFQLMHEYKKHKNDQGAKQAILDYYQDYRDNESTRID